MKEKKMCCFLFPVTKEPKPLCVNINVNNKNLTKNQTKNDECLENLAKKKMGNNKMRLLIVTYDTLW